MKQLLVICAVVALVGCGAAEEKSAKAKAEAAKAKAAAEARWIQENLNKNAKKPIAKPASAETKAAAWVSDPNDPNNVTIEAAIRTELKYIGESPTGELTQSDLKKVTELELDRKQLTSVKGLEKLTQLESLHLPHNKLTNVKGLEKLTQLERLHLDYNPDLTKAQIDELKKALPKCDIRSNPTK